MCKKVNNAKIPNTRIDKCIKMFIEHLNLAMKNYRTVSSCCGHGKYPITIIVIDQHNQIFDLVSGVSINRTRKFYKRDKDGFYYVPESIGKRW